MKKHDPMLRSKSRKVYYTAGRGNNRVKQQFNFIKLVMNLYTAAVGILTYHFHSCYNDQKVLQFVIGSEVLYFIKGLLLWLGLS